MVPVLSACNCASRSVFCKHKHFLVTNPALQIREVRGLTRNVFCICFSRSAYSTASRICTALIVELHLLVNCCPYLFKQSRLCLQQRQSNIQRLLCSARSPLHNIPDNSRKRMNIFPLTCASANLASAAIRQTVAPVILSPSEGAEAAVDSGGCTACIPTLCIEHRLMCAYLIQQRLQCSYRRVWIRYASRLVQFVNYILQ